MYHEGGPGYEADWDVAEWDAGGDCDTAGRDEFCAIETLSVILDVADTAAGRFGILNGRRFCEEGSGELEFENGPARLAGADRMLLSVVSAGGCSVFSISAAVLFREMTLASNFATASQ